MTNYGKFKILKIVEFSESRKFYLDGCVSFKHGVSYKDIDCVDHYPFNSFQVGDCIEIDLDYARRYACNWNFNDTNAIRKVSSSAVVSSNSSQQMTTSQFQTIGNQMMDRAERSGGQMEARWIAREEYRTDGSVSAREFGWRYGNKN